MRQQSTFRGFGFVLLMLILIAMAAMLPHQGAADKITHQELVTLLSEDHARIAQVTINQNPQVPTGEVIINMADGTEKQMYVTDVNEVEQLLRQSGIDGYNVTDVPQENILLTVALPILLSTVVVVIIIMVMNRSAGGGGANARMMNFGKSRARMSRDNKVNFSNVAGLEEEKEELEEVVDFLRNPQKYTSVGARIPKGLLLVGPPGTGKTLLAKAVAGEAGVPFFSISGSDFVEMFVGVGASRVRDLFEEAKKNSPCIVFIDEIDAVARRRGTGMGGGHDEREQTLNQLLVEMDGFGVNEGIIVMAATNRVDILDPAILRPGRFDRKVAVGRPDVRGREEILKVHAKDKPLGEDVDLRRVAQTTAGFTGADLENLMNEAAILSAREGRRFIRQSDIDRAFVKVGIGAEKRSKVITEKDKKITAYHEAGHAILFHVLPDVGPVHTVSIIPTGVGAAGYTMPLPERDEMFNTRGKMLQNIMVDLGGRIAEELIFDDITTGASQDIKQATQIARSMVTQYGMSDKVGMIQYGSDDDEVFIGRDLAHTKSYGNGMADTIDSEVKRIIDDCYQKARSIIKEYEYVLHSCANLLIEKEKIGQDEFEALFNAPTVTA
ncbi:ATP-dependent zinc metalloprotease FtsH [Clostridium sp. AF18-27]|uniref:ATP-dependent zinc metalloprotease FtsH n=1 Tax=Enterocloster TaxID=2719313 RepID=UPI000D1ADE13|nr:MULTISPECIES: ATP-dependent zinc metalloprotease FtsH [Enterocloster]MBS5604061.1 ATP-dependent zinc metalloprotease FtsH [Enterocloster asparagiformis]RHR45082.1 ATP-dependent zinc metalloprotease FtsH [Clostridium sp. AF18-27]MCB6342522.1 ATP-dependent zinc metalloprotease FtsH [Enterocloster lavalensis]MDR3759903.1 ATP-dependent zinc metalloprotease FtsH [Enterocloster sp.]PST31631.1 cell division protein FtsH [Enterocloster lavalensis]